MAAIADAAGKRTALAGAERAALLVLTIRIAGAGLAYATQVVMARLMGRADYGVFATVWSLVCLLGHGSLWGFGQAACRFVPHYRARGEAGQARGFVLFGAGAVAAAATVTAVAAALVLQAGAGPADPDHRAALVLGLAILPLFAAQDYAEALARSLGRTGLAVAPPYILRQSLIGLAMLAAVAAGLAPQPRLAIACAGLALAVTLAVQAGLILPLARSALAGGRVLMRPRRWSAAALPMALSEWVATGFGFVDVLLVGLMRPAEEAAVYFAVTRVLQLLLFLPYAASTATAQRYSEARARAAEPELRALIRRTARLVGLASLGAGAAVVAAGPLLLGLFGAGFGEGLTALSILVAGVVAQSAFGPGEDVLTMLGAERLCAGLSLAAFAAAVVLEAALIPLLGITGAALGMAIAGVLRGFLLAQAAQSRLGLATHLGAPS